MTTYKERTREEVLSWLKAARQRKTDWEHRMKEKWQEEDRLRREVAASHYYDIEGA